MHEDSIIDRSIAAILAGSGLPLERRAEVADERAMRSGPSVAYRFDAWAS